MLSSRVATYIRDHAIFTPGERVLVAVSGGPDSLGLLAILRDLQPTLPVHLTVAHFDHGWRGDSAEDATFVAALADRWGYQRIMGQARSPLARAADILAEEDHLANDITTRTQQSVADPLRDQAAFAEQPVAIQRRLLRRLLPDLDFEHVESRRREILTGRAPDAGHHPTATTASRQTLTVHPCTCDPATFYARDRIGHVDASAVVPPLTIAHRAPGDRIQPLGFPYPKKLQDVLVDAHVPRHLRDALPIVRDAVGIVWIPGVTVAETRRVTPASTQQLHLEIVPS